MKILGTSAALGAARGFLTTMAVWLMICRPAFAVPVEVKISPTQGVLHLLQSLRGRSGRSPQLAKIFQERRPLRPADSHALQAFEHLLRQSEWADIDLPGEQGRPRKLEAVLEQISVQAADDEDFLRRCEPLLNQRDLDDLSRCVRHFGPPYRDLVWNPSLAGLTTQKVELEELIRRSRFSKRLDQVSRLFGSAWPAQRPFVVVLVPIPRQPGEKVLQFAHSNAPLEVVEALAGASMAQEAGVIFHEIVHSLWYSRTVARQPLPGYADHFLNEGLAAALGNGWFQALVDERPARGRWYGDPYVDGFAHALLPVLESYLARGTPLDSAFCGEAARVFAETFPDVDRDPRVTLREIVLLSSQDLGRAGYVKKIKALPGVGGIETRGLDLERLNRAGDVTTAIFLLTPREAAALGLREGTERRGDRWVLVCLGEDLAAQFSALERLLARTFPKTR